MNIAIDMMGGDFAPGKAAEGIALFFEMNKFEGTLTLLGDEQQLHTLLNGKPFFRQLNIVPTRQVIGMNEHPVKALKEKQDSSIAVGFYLLASGKTDALISAGNTGAMMIGALHSIKAIEGVSRPAIGAYMPREDGKLGLLIDVGLNADCKAENLSQFAVMGSLFAKHILGFDSPRVALINVGEEEGKGNLLCLAAYPILRENTQINFVGNAEGRDLLKGKAEVFVCEGFAGNVILKFAESFYDIVVKRKIEDAYLKRFNFEMYGGVPVLGVNKPVIIGHGISGGLAFCNMIEIAGKMIKSDFINTLKSAFRSS